jgi:7-carboxy-7-deazaguanine synthase
MIINLVQNGIFPISYDKEGNPLNQEMDTGLKIPGTVQGEGKWIGTSCIFIRTTACNLRCAWVGVDGKGSPCDTPYSSHKPEKNKQEIEDVVTLVKANTNNGAIKHVVVSGGEPTMQTENLEELLKRLTEEGFKTTIETNATIYSDGIAKYTNLCSMSPKLASSTPWEANLVDTGIGFNQKWAERHERDRKNIPVIQSYIDNCYEKDENGNIDYTKRKQSHDFQLKFVVLQEADIEEIENDFLKHLKGVNNDDVCLMPEGVTADDLMTRSYWTIEACIKRGWRFTPRLHALLFGVKRGV